MIVPLALLAIAGIILTQTYWMRRMYGMQERAFKASAHAGLRSAAGDIMRLRGAQPPALLPVETPEHGVMAVPLGVAVKQEVLEHYLSQAFAVQNLVTDFSYALYDCSSRTLSYTGYHRMGHRGGEEPPHKFAPLRRSSYYLAVHFPRRGALPLGEVTLWGLCTVVLLGVVTFLCYLLYIIFRQRRLSEIQKDFLQNMTHEFQTPLSTILLSAEVIRAPGALSDPARVQRYAGIIAGESTRLSAQVDRALHMYRIGRGEALLVREPIVWQELLRDAADAYRHAVEMRGGTLDLEMPEAPLSGRGDARSLLNAVAAIIDNALQYCEAAPAIRIVLIRRGSKAVVRVQDNGRGIAKAHQRRIFRKFYRVPTGNVHNAKGFGLGLSYAEATARAHGSTIECKSAVNAGTTFTLTFPLSAPIAAPAHAGNVQG